MNDQTDLYKKIAVLGLPFMEPQESFNTNATLAEVIESKELRFLEGFPVLLLNAAKNYNFDYQQVETLLDSQGRRLYAELLVLSLALYEYYRLRYAWAVKIKKTFTTEQKSQLKTFRQALSRNGALNCADSVFSAERLKAMFDLYYENESVKDHKKKEKFNRLSLEYSMSQLFSPKQKDLFNKKLDGVSLSKTENEYYSRSVKKKVVALANAELHSMARKILEQ